MSGTVPQVVAAPPPAGTLDQIDLARARLWAFLARFLARPPDAELLAEAAALPSDRTPLGSALGAVARAAAASSPESAAREYEALLIGVERGEVVPYASYYRTGLLNDRPLADLRRDMRTLGLERAPGVPEPEDHIASLCEIMAGLITGELGASGEAGQRRFFLRHLAPWAGRFFADLEEAGAAVLYRPLAVTGRRFVAIEAEAFAMAEVDPSGG